MHAEGYIKGLYVPVFLVTERQVFLITEIQVFLATERHVFLVTERQVVYQAIFFLEESWVLLSVHIISLIKMI